MAAKAVGSTHAMRRFAGVERLAGQAMFLAAGRFSDFREALA